MASLVHKLKSGNFSATNFPLAKVPALVSELQAMIVPVPLPTPTPVPTPLPTPVPSGEQPSAGIVLFASKDWTVDHPATWHATCSPEITTGSNTSLYATVTPQAADELVFALKGFRAAGFSQSGARDLLDPRQLRTWDGLSWLICKALGIPFAVKELIGNTIEFFDVWNCPAFIPNFYGDGGFQCFAWQFKNDARANANAGMAVNVHTFKDQNNAMRFWLQTNDWALHAQDDLFPIIPIGQDYVTRLTVRFDSDPAKGSMKLDFLGKSLQVMGANCAPDGGCGPYKANYGVAEGVLISRRTVITLLNEKA